ncbi:MAG TPA: GNAT family N-acetyltransferase [Solirubrobacteraceae bacterium]|jgi:GNAT superfamily N-acetyltransferase|nr:GNAT family N-acetyltransferase [Solirubrobacteraceae bacterium]
MRRELDGGFELDDDRARIDIDEVHRFISTESYWGLGRSRELVERTVAGSARVVGLYDGSESGRQIGFARAISDGVSLAYLADVYVLEPYRGRGLGLELVREIVERSFGRVRWMLHTADAQRLYLKLGFSEDAPPYKLMERSASLAASDQARQ